MEFFHCPFCTKWVVTPHTFDVLQKTMCKKCFKVFYVGFDEKGIHIYKEQEVIVNKINNTLILKSQIDKELQPKMKKRIHELNKQLTKEAADAKQQKIN